MATNLEVLAAEEAGKKAYQDGVPHRCNPYRERDLKKAWWEGWYLAQYDMKKASQSTKEGR